MFSSTCASFASGYFVSCTRKHGIERGEGGANNVRSSESTQNVDVSPITMVFFVEEIATSS